MSISQIYAQKTPATATNTAISEPTPSTNDTYGLKEKIFRESLKYGDLLVAKQALYEMIVLKPDMKNLKDSLAYIYVNLGAFREAILLSREITDKDPNNIGVLEVKAIAEQSLGLSKEALTSYETLFSKTKNVFHQYQIASLQYELKRIQECVNTVDQILSTAEIEKKELNIGTGTRGQLQRVNLKAAAFNIKGVLAMDLNQMDVAKQLFDEALKLTPEFVLAKNNAAFVVEKMKPAAKSTPAPKAPKK
ncbi:MAG: hypothetical protein NW207_11065 [Cytophagales bacterium]|nr:hypothetical protein [Cytophagales bacterium]